MPATTQSASPSLDQCTQVMRAKESNVRAFSTIIARAVVPVAFIGPFLWAYWPTLDAMSHRWLVDPQYSHGYLVPVFAVWLLWLRRSCLNSPRVCPSWWGCSLLLASVILRLAGAFLYFDWLEAVSMVPCLAGLFVLLGGWPALAWSWSALAFLVFMIPLPFRLEIALALPLQQVATSISTYLMQTIGLPALAEGNTIVLTRGRIGVVEACSGLSMMVLFCALSTGVAILLKRPLLDKLVIIASAALIAVLANVARIALTGVAYEWLSPEIASSVFHNFAGLLMMPFALALLGLELWVLSRLLKEPAPARAPGLDLPKPSLTSAPALLSKQQRRNRHQKGPLPRPVGNGQSG